MSAGPSARVENERNDASRKPGTDAARVPEQVESSSKMEGGLMTSYAPVARQEIATLLAHSRSIVMDAANKAGRADVERNSTTTV